MLCNDNNKFHIFCSLPFSRPFFRSLHNMKIFIWLVAFAAMRIINLNFNLRHLFCRSHSLASLETPQWLRTMSDSYFKFNSNFIFRYLPERSRPWNEWMFLLIAQNYNNRHWEQYTLGWCSSNAMGNTNTCNRWNVNIFTPNNIASIIVKSLHAGYQITIKTIFNWTVGLICNFFSGFLTLSCVLLSLSLFHFSLSISISWSSRA